MIQSAELEKQFNEKSGSHAIRNYGFCETLRDYLNDIDEKERPEAIGYFFSSGCYCKECKKMETCKILSSYSDFKEGAMWLLGQVSQNLAERYIIEHIGIRT
jgi:hypothetical protein